MALNATSDKILDEILKKPEVQEKIIEMFLSTNNTTTATFNKVIDGMLVKLSKDLATKMEQRVLKIFSKKVDEAMKGKNLEFNIKFELK